MTDLLDTLLDTHGQKSETEYASIISYDLYTLADAYGKAVEANKEKYKDELAVLDKDMAELKTQIDEVKGLYHSYNAKVERGNNSMKFSAVSVGKQLGIGKYLTPNGTLSMAKVKKLKTREEMANVISIYNNQYVKAANEAVRQAAENRAEPTEEEVAGKDRYILLAREYNALNAKRRDILERV